MYENKTIRLNNIKKSKNDKNNYLFKILPNGLKTLIISDLTTNKSAACLIVNVGHLVDNEEVPGIAHFCEHMLFMGSKNYTDVNYFQKFLQKNGGNSNAYTTLDKTCFYYDVSNEFFNESLHIFSQYFISPLFDKNYIEKEMNAVDSENQKNISNDIWRLSQLRKSESNPESGFNKFSTGNLKTLNIPNIREKLLEFYNQYYTSEIMDLCIYSNDSIENLEKIIDELFSQIPKRDNFIKPIYDKVLPYTKENLQYLYKIVPVKDIDQIKFIWYLPYDVKYYKIKPLDYISGILGHEGPNSLTSSLIKDDFINSLLVVVEKEANIYSELILTISLTKKGVENVRDIMLRVFKFLQILKAQKINKNYFEETKQIMDLFFEYKNKNEPLTIVKNNILNINLYDYEDILIGPYIMEEYDEDLITNYLNMINQENCLIYLLSRKYENECNLTEKWYGTKYSKEKFNFSEEEINNYKCLHPLNYPPPNEFLPDNMNILSNPEKEEKYPILISKTKNCSIWHKQDTIFKLPKTIIQGRIILQKDICSNNYIKNIILSEIMDVLLTNQLGELSYMAVQANIVFSFEISYSAVSISVSGFSSSIKKTFKIIMENFKKMDFSTLEDKFNLQLQKFIQAKSNYYLSTNYSVCYNYLSKLLISNNPTVIDIVNAINNSKITVNDLVNFSKNIFNNSSYEWLIQGNISKEDALELVENTNKALELNILNEITPYVNIKRVVNISYNTNYIYVFYSPNKQEKNSSIASFYQFGKLTEKEKLYLILISAILKDKFYDDLRTKQTLGYVVILTEKSFLQNCGIVCLVQSTSKPPEFISMKIREFFKNNLKTMEELSDSEFNSHIKSILMNLERKDNNLNQEVIRNFIEISTHNYLFNRNEIKINLLKKCNKIELIKLYKKYFFEDVRKIDVEYVAECHKEENEKILKEIKEENIRRIILNNLEEFTGYNSLFPNNINHPEIILE